MELLWCDIVIRHPAAEPSRGSPIRFVLDFLGVEEVILNAVEDVA
jgi:hypothetical protein